MPLVLPPAVDPVLDGLSRWPDVGADLVAVDAADRLLLAEAAPLLATCGPGEVVVIDDAYGALALGAVALGARDVRVHTDAVTSERAILANAARLDGVPRPGDPATRATSLPGAEGRDMPALLPELRVEPALTPSVVGGARLVLARLPRALDALAEQAALVADHAAADVTFLATGRLKHMTRSMNEVLASRFDDVRATLAHGKSRALVARSPRPAPAGAVPFPRSVHHGDVGLDVVAHGAAFAGTSLDIGTRFLLTFLDDVAADLPEGGTGLDLGCGTGLLASAVARAVPSARVVATDRSAAAVASAALTARANGVGDRVEVLRDDVAASVPDASVDVVVCNPPFHAGAAISTDIASAMFRAAARVLRPGGVLWTVYNTPLRYRGELGRVVGPTTHAGQNPKFTVTRSVRG